MSRALLLLLLAPAAPALRAVLAVLIAASPLTLAAVALVLTGATVAAGVWSYRADPPQWFPPPGWAGEPIR